VDYDDVGRGRRSEMAMAYGIGAIFEARMMR
jgi:hypothetical protein